MVEGTTQADAADGAPAAVAFGSITYTSKSLQDDSEATPNANTKTVNGDGTVTYTYKYRVSEVTDGLIASGVTPGTTTFNVDVKVTDNGKGELSIAVDYFGKDLAFTNTYGATAKADLPVKGYKKLTTPEGTGWNAPDITGKYTFTITCDTENAPMPVNKSVTNGEGGVIDFGSITYTMENVFGNEPTATSDDGAEQASATRTKTFVYTITESLTGEKVPGVSMDGPKTFEVTVTDNGNGTLSPSVKDTANQGFEFENKYTVEEEPSSLTGEGNFTLTKTLEGRAMTEGEFTFNLYEGKNIVATGTNDAYGNVEMDSVPFTKPGTYTYVLSEEPGEAGNGVAYDTAWYTVTATATDNSDGTLSVAWSAKKGADGDEIATTEPIVFANTYEAKPASAYLVASKEYTGAQLKADQFTFQVLNEDGGVVAEAKNDAMGLVAFPVIDDLNTEGTFTYTISEVNDGQEGVTYDGAQHKATVTVTDEGTGHLTATVAYENGTAPVFTNAYTEPEGPSDPGGGKPGKPEPPALADTSDKLGPLTIGLAVLAVAAGAGIAVAAVKMRRKAGTHHRVK